MQLRLTLLLVLVHVLHMNYVGAIRCKSSYCVGCNRNTGWCRSCTGNHVLPRCISCIKGYHGVDCVTKCGRCKMSLNCMLNITCNQCEKNYQMPVCTACITGKYGSSCQKNCNCYKDYACDELTGSCRHYGCAMFWSGKNKCDTKNECPVGKFGTKCVSCGKCKLYCRVNQRMCVSDCNRTTGECKDHQCMAYFTGRRCDTCVKQRYGLHCQYKCGQCLKDMCNRVTGLCLEGCNSGYKGYKCDLPCKAGYYGYNCAQKCGKCADNVSCSRITGECPGRKCAYRFKGDYCEQDKTDIFDCPTGLFGINCNQNCGNCAKGTVCNSADGTCPNGCMDRYEAPFCFTCSKGYFGKSCEETCGHCKNKEICDGFSGACPQGCANGFTGHYCKKRIEKSEEPFTDDISNYFDIDNF